MVEEEVQDILNILWAGEWDEDWGEDWGEEWQDNHVWWITSEDWDEELAALPSQPSFVMPDGTAHFWDRL